MNLFEKAVNWFFRLETVLLRQFYLWAKLRPTSAPFLSGDGFRALADHRFEGLGSFDPSLVKSHQVVFVESGKMEPFFRQVMPAIDRPIVVVTHNGDDNVGPSQAVWADDPNLLRWFAQNLDTIHPKILAIPIGLENAWMHSNGIVGDFKKIRAAQGRKKSRILFGFTTFTNPAERIPALKTLRDHPCCDALSWVNGRRYRQILAGYQFIASPPGNGIDCHRTWEALYLRVVPIVKRSAAMEAFSLLPIWIVDDWKELEGLSETDLDLKYRELSRKGWDHPLLWLETYRDLFRKFEEPHDQKH